MAGSISLVLSKGTHLIDAPARDRVLDAIERGERTVEIPVDRYADGAATTATIVTAHVVAFFPHDDCDDTELPLNVSPFVRRA
ncbi:MAG TPA: hypothetical protein VGC96_11880 [Candidatus Elarobacter sp.]|jgi:hypothetical protein